MQFVNLHVHTAIGSMLDSMIRVNELFDKCKELDQPAVAITDHGTCNAYFDLYKEYARTGVKGIPGIEGYFIHNPENKEEKNKHIVLLAQNEVGCRNIMRLNYEAHKNIRIIYMKPYPRMTWDLLKKYNEGIICLTGCVNGIIARHIQNDDPKAALRDLERMQDIFKDRLYLEVQPHSLREDNVNQYKVNKNVYSLHKRTGIPMVATNDVHYISREDHKYHDMLLAVGDKKPLSAENRKRYSANEFYLKTATHVIDYFGKDLGEMLCHNTLEVAERCESPDYLKNEKGNYYLPKFPVEDEKDFDEFSVWKEKKAKDVKQDVAYLRYRSIKKFKQFDFGDKKKEYWNRIKKEMRVFEEKNLCSYMLIVADYIQAARDRGCPVGPGRGSSAGSLTAMILGITEIDPIKYGLMFERFVNPLREQLADIDTDFGDPEVVKQYLIEKYGREHVASIANIIYLRPKVVITDIVRSLEIGGSKSAAFGIAKKITDTIPDDAKTVEDAFAHSTEFKDYMLKYPEVYTYTIKLQNLPRQHGIHAAGVVISPKDRPLPDYLPLKMDKHGVVATQYDKDRVEDGGYLKVDVLGLSNLNTIESAIQLIKDRGKKGPDKQSDIEDGDKKAFDLISAGDTLGVFQLEASLAPLCKTLKPRSISEISDINALGRPGCPPEEREDFIKRKQGIIKARPLHPKLKNSMHRTYHKCVYEEDLLALGQGICGWDFGRADIMRRICKGKEKTKHLLPKLKEDFVNDAYINGVKKEDASKLFEIVNYFSGYGFNRSHSVCYSTIAYRTAHLKAHFPTEFLTALINSENPNSEKIKIYQTEIRSKGIEILPPNINKSQRRYSIEGSKKIRMGLNSIKGVGDKAIESIIKNRPYKTPMDFVQKVNHSIVNKNVVASLNNAGCFDFWKIPRKVFEENFADFKNKYRTAANKKKDKIIKKYVEEVEKNNPDTTKEEIKLIVKDMKKTLGLPRVEIDYTFPDEEDWSLKEKLERERSVLGDYLSGSINDVYGDFFDSKFTYAKPLDGLAQVPDGQVVRFEGVIRKKLREFKIKNKNSKNYGKAFGKYLIEDLHKNLSELTVWPEKYRKLKAVLESNTPIICTCTVSSFGGNKSLSLKNVVKI